MTLTQEEFIRLSLDGAKAAAAAAEGAVQQALCGRDPKTPVAFPDTAFFLPFANALLDREVRELSQLPELVKTASSFISDGGDMASALGAGIATLLSAEVIEALRYLSGQQPAGGFSGFLGDAIYRSLGLVLVDGRMTGVCVMLGAAPEAKIAASLIRELQSKNILTLLHGSSGGANFKDQLSAENVAMGLDSYVVPVGLETTTLIHAVNFVARVALSFGGIKKGDVVALLKYVRERAPVFMVALGELDALKISAISAVLKLGLPVVTDQELPQMSASQALGCGALAPVRDAGALISKGIELKGIKIRVDKIDIPVNYSAAFEGERVRREAMHVEFGGGRSPAFEWVRLRPADEVKDGAVTFCGPEIDKMKEGAAYPLGIIVDVAGKKMETDFEPVLERQIHRFLNYAMGVFHIGQRDMNWVRVSREAFAAGLKIRDFGKILHAKFHGEYGNIVDRVAVTLLTSREEMDKVLPEVRAAYARRDERLLSLRDDTVETFYSCTLCTSFAPNHVCVISPERMGLCGAISWLDAKTAYEISPTGGNKPIARAAQLDAAKGEWKGVNDFVYDNSHKTIERLCLYSLMDAPMSACGCFECIAAVMPEANGVIIVNREYDGMTPVGMKFTTLAGSVGGGQQTPGFMGIAKRYITSRMFISSDGGLKRVVWMPKALKEMIRSRLSERAKDIGIPDFADKIADETTATDAETLVKFLERVGHPALSMPALV